MLTRTGGAARAAHAISHLLDGGAVGRVHRIESSSIEVAAGYVHAYDFIVYAHLHSRRTQKQKLRRRRLPPPLAAELTFRAWGFTDSFCSCLDAGPARAGRGADWKGAAALPVYESPIAAANSLYRFARGLGMARWGGAASAKGEITAIGEMRTELEKAGNSYWAGRSEEHMLAVSGLGCVHRRQAR